MSAGELRIRDEMKNTLVLDEVVKTYVMGSEKVHALRGVSLEIKEE